jgi:mRNA interferase MazF
MVAPNAKSIHIKKTRRETDTQAMKRGEIHWAQLDPVEGSELSKTRPCVIVSRDELNAVLPTVVVCPLTSVVRPKWRTRLQIVCAGRKADVCAEQIRTVSKSRLRGGLGTLEKNDIKALCDLLAEMYGTP